ncbi:hypothetical protein Kisp01_34920 [Kineosporia sp. NBRC 101677]|nr:hypothetical protein Kisp01_34920 [Kineosporia sp. NBRC 101677]
MSVGGAQGRDSVHFFTALARLSVRPVLWRTEQSAGGGRAQADGGSGVRDWCAARARASGQGSAQDRCPTSLKLIRVAGRPVSH